MNKERQLRFVRTIFEIAEKQDFSFDFRTHGYAEPGYSGEIIAFANWNNKTSYNRDTNEYVLISDFPSRVAKVLERLGVECEWSDEWTFCDHCQRPVRTNPNGAFWLPSYYSFDESGERICCLCAPEFADEIIEDLIGKETRALTLDIPKEGFVCLQERFERGLHEHQSDDPTVIAKSLRELGVERFFFVLNDSSPFDTQFSVWVEADVLTDEFMAMWENANTRSAVSPADQMKAFLKGIR